MKKPIMIMIAIIIITSIMLSGCSGSETADTSTIKEEIAAETPENGQKDSGAEVGKDAEVQQKTEEEYVEVESGSPEYIEFDNITASSTLKASSNNSYEPRFVTDWKRETAWVEGKDDDGIGEWIKLEKDNPIKVSGIEINNGYLKSESIYKANNRVKTIKIEFSNGESITKGLKDEFGANNLIEFDKPIETSYIKLTILDVYKGSKYNDTCISEIHAFNTPTIKMSKEEYEEYMKEQEEIEEKLNEITKENQNHNENETKKPAYIAETTSGLRLLEVNGTEDEFAKYIEGIVENPTNKDIEMVTISFIIYDSEGNQIEESFDSVNVIKAKGRWKFKAMVTSEDAVRIELNDLTSW